MERNDSLADLGQRLGFFAYMTVMSGGRLFWPALIEGSAAIDQLAGLPGEPGGSVTESDPFVDTVPYEYQNERHDHIAA